MSSWDSQDFFLHGIHFGFHEECSQSPAGLLYVKQLYVQVFWKLQLSIIFWLELASFLKRGTTFTCFQSRGTSPVDSDCLNILVKTGVSSLKHCFKMLIGILLGPLAFFC